jgi:hypothetical protein
MVASARGFIADVERMNLAQYPQLWKVQHGKLTRRLG